MTPARADGAGWAQRLREAGVAEPLAGRLGGYLEMLARWAAAVDLIGELGEEELISGHVLESLAALPFLPEDGTLLDVGSGNGFPAIPILLARPKLTGVLLEPRERRWAFLREVARELSLPVGVVRERVAEHRGGPYPLVTVRGVAMETWLPHARRLLGEGGTLVWWTGDANAHNLAGEVKEGRVLTFPLPEPGRGCLAVWRRCST